MRSARIAMFNMNETQRDPRVRRVAEALVQHGYKVQVFEVRLPNQAAQEHLDGYDVVRVQDPQSYTPEDMLGIEQTCGAIGAILRKCSPGVMDGAKIYSLWHQVRYAVRQRLRSARQVFHASTPQGEARTFDFCTEILAIRSIMLINLALYKEAQKFQPDIAYCNDLDTLVTGALFKINHGAVVIFDAHEIYPEQLAEHMRSDTWYKFYSRLERYLLPLVDGRLTVCDSLGSYFTKKYKTGPFLTLRNTPSIKHLPVESVLDRRNSPVKILYHGAYFQYRGLDEIISIAKYIDRAIFIFRGIGAYEQELKAQVVMQHLESRVQFEPPVPVYDLVSTASICDIGLNPFISVCLNTQYALPNKFFEYMMAGLALASTDLIEMRLLTHKLGNGVLFNSRDPENIVRSLNSLVYDTDRLHAYRKRSYEAAKTEFHWEHEARKLTDYMCQFV